MRYTTLPWHWDRLLWTSILLFGTHSRRRAAAGREPLLTTEEGTAMSL